MLPAHTSLLLQPLFSATIALQVSPPNQGHKKRCMLGLLQDAVEEHNAELAALLRERGGGRELRLIVETEDFGVTWRAAKWKLPAFAGLGRSRLGGDGQHVILQRLCLLGKGGQRSPSERGVIDRLGRRQHLVDVNF